MEGRASECSCNVLDLNLCPSVVISTRPLEVEVKRQWRLKLQIDLVGNVTELVIDTISR